MVKKWRVAGGGWLGCALLTACTQPVVQQQEADEPTLHAQVEMQRDGNVFTYTLVNGEPRGSENYITVWGTYPHAAFSLVSKPEGWKCETDGLTHLDCANTDEKLPYPHDGAPGRTLRFVIKSNVVDTQKAPFLVVAWDHAKDTNGLAASGEVLVPFDPSVKGEEDE